MVEELRARSITFRQQVPVKVYYRNVMVGDYFADLLVDDKVIVELKCTASLTMEHECQLINYLKATGLEVGLLLNFGTKPQIRRKIYTKDRK